MDCYLDHGSVDVLLNELFRLRQENENLRNRISELEDEIRECYESIEIDKIPDISFDDWLENDYSYEEE